MFILLLPLCEKMFHQEISIRLKWEVTFEAKGFVRKYDNYLHSSGFGTMQKPCLLAYMMNLSMIFF